MNFPSSSFLLKSLAAAFCLLALSMTPVSAADPLPSWREGAARSNLLAFVAAVTTPGSPDFVPPAERIAVFDNDGTLWLEQPSYTQFRFGMDRIQKTAAQHTALAEKEPFRSALSNNLDGVIASGVHGLIELTAATHGGLTTTEFERIASDWLGTARHPKYQQPYTNCVYQPMLEVLAYFRAHGFKNYIVSGGALEFMRPWTESVYGIPPEHLIGSTVKTRLEVRDGQPVIVRLPEIDLLNDKTEKVLSIQRFIGRRPIAALGNSDGDLPMLQWTAARPGRSFCLYVHHTDAVREYAYDRQALTGRLDKGLDEAKAKGWTVVDMQQDWKRVFPFQQETPDEK